MLKFLLRVGLVVTLVGGTLLGYGLYSLHQSDEATAHAQQELSQRLRQVSPANDPTVGVGHSPQQSDAKVALGDPLAFLVIPRFGSSWQRAIVQGTDLPQLAQGPGHYVRTAMPGQVGNFAIAGHSSGHGAPFGDLAALRPGDVIIVQTPAKAFTYHMTGSRVVKPTDIAVLDPTPGQSTMTLTTCYPVYALHPDRLVVSAVLVTS